MSSLTLCYLCYHPHSREPDNTPVPAVQNFLPLQINMAKRCSVCDGWIKTGGGAHICPGAPAPKPPSNPPQPKAQDELSTLFNIDDDKAPLLCSFNLI